MVLLTRKTQIAIKREATEGTAVTPTADDAKLKVYDPAYDYAPELHNREPSRKFLGQVKGVVGKIPATISWRSPVKGSGSVGTRPAFDAALVACGFTGAAISAMTLASITGTTFQPGETITGSSSSATGRVVTECAAVGTPMRFVSLTGTFNTDDVITGGTSGVTASVDAAPIASQGWEYKRDSSSPSATVSYYLDGKLNKARGCRGNVTIDARAGEPAMFGFSFSGEHLSESDAALLTVTEETTVEPVVESASYSFRSRTDCIDTFTIDAGNDVVERTCASASRGVKSFRITNWHPTISIDPEDVLVATASFRADLEARRSGRFYMEIGSDAGNRIAIAAPSFAYSGAAEGDRNGISTRNLTLDLMVKDTTDGDDELTIVMF